MFRNQYITVSTTEAAVHVLDDVTASHLDSGFSLAMKYSRPLSAVYASIFGEGTRNAFKCTPEMLDYLATQYTGLHGQRVNYLAAALLLGEPIEPPTDSDVDGGQPAVLPSDPSPLPSGGNTGNMYLDSATKRLSEIAGKPVTIEFQETY
jgi:hypothetical protein